jgi:hypothetical protein
MGVQPTSREIAKVQGAQSMIIGGTGQTRSIEEIGQALTVGQPITGEEQLRWRAARQFKA